MFASLNTATRLMTLTFPRRDGPQAVLLVNELQGKESLSADFVYTLQVLSDNPAIKLKDVQGKMVCVELLRNDHSKRYFTGHCFKFSLQSLQNGIAIYQMELRPWLAFLRLRSNQHIFQNKTVLQQAQEIFLHYATARFDANITEADPPHTFACQHGETDYNYLVRHEAVIKAVSLQ